MRANRKKQSTMIFLAVKEACWCWQADGTKKRHLP
jgi:hypothetical protein